MPTPISSSFSGLVGIKTTTGRCPIQDTGLNGTLVVTGPLADNVTDATLLYSIMAGPDVSTPYSMYQSNLLLSDKTFGDIDGMKVGIDWTWAKQSDPEVYKNFEKSVHVLKAAGCQIESMQLPEIDLGTREIMCYANNFSKKYFIMFCVTVKKYFVF